MKGYRFKAKPVYRFLLGGMAKMLFTSLALGVAVKREMLKWCAKYHVWAVLPLLSEEYW